MSSGSPLVDLVAHGDWITMQAYFQKCGAELEAVKRSSKFKVDRLSHFAQGIIAWRTHVFGYFYGRQGGTIGWWWYRITCSMYAWTLQLSFMLVTSNDAGAQDACFYILCVMAL